MLLQANVCYLSLYEVNKRCNLIFNVKVLVKWITSVDLSQEKQQERQEICELMWAELLYILVSISYPDFDDSSYMSEIMFDGASPNQDGEEEIK